MGIDLRDVDKEFYLKIKELNMVSSRMCDITQCGKIADNISVSLVGHVNSCW